MKFNFKMKLFFLLSLLFSTIAHAGDLKILSWNVFMLPKPIKFTLQAERTPLIINELIKSQADVIFLQEAFQSEFREQLFKKTKQSYPYQYYLDRQPGTMTVYGSGVYLLSRYPFKILHKVYFDDCAKADCFASKGTFLVELTTPAGQKAQFAPTHLQSNDAFSAIRLKQLADINAIFSISAQNGVSQFLIGDLNIDGLSGTEYKTALDYMHMASSPLEGEPGYSNGFPTICYNKPGDDKKEWIDHIWMKPIISTARVLNKRVRPYSAVLEGKDCPLSDHYAIEATLKL